MCRLDAPKNKRNGHSQQKDSSKTNHNTLHWAWYLPLAVTLFCLGVCVVLEHSYHAYVVPIIDSYRRSPLDRRTNLIDTYRNDFTYYNRHCNKDDLTTKNSSDLLITPNMTSQQASQVMLQHGAVALQNILTPETATNLRSYLANKHNELPLHYNEVFWHETDRLSLALGTHDHPSIGAALMEVGKNANLQKTLHGLLGPDPAIVEISTLTAMHGCSDQGIHSDSDWFGSSLLYGRTFLHSYSMFIALQDTSQALGATTVCPGSHYCADEDLESVCLDNGAFSVSTNGQTGEDGMLGIGDGFLFNQNIWHRGPANTHASQDRIMFILTFVSQPSSVHDYRRQGLGTYYYQRWNMWGHTYNDLKDAPTILTQPWAGLRALGLLPSKGVPWIHQFSQQVSNGDDFYDDNELMDMKQKLLSDKPEFLFSSAKTWMEFIPETFHIWTLLCAKVYAGVCLITLALSSRAPKRLIVLHLLFGLALMGAVWHVSQTKLAQSAITGNVHTRPYSSTPTNVDSGRRTTFPERNDVLIATRFDSEFLASFTHFLDYHPGNKQYLAAVTEAAKLPEAARLGAPEAIVNQTLADTELGLPTRFLYQNYANGAWEIMSREEAVAETRRMILTHADPAYADVQRQLKHDLSIHRFGDLRDTPVARSAIENTEAMMSQVSGDCGPSSDGDAPPKDTCLNPSPNGFGTHMESPESRSKRTDSSIHSGDKIWAWEHHSQLWYEATFLGDSSDDRVEFEFFFGAKQVRSTEYVRKYYSLQSGDRVAVDYHENEEEFFEGTITFVHPDGFCSVSFDDGDFLERIGREYILLLEA